MHSISLHYGKHGAQVTPALVRASKSPMLTLDNFAAEVTRKVQRMDTVVRQVLQADINEPNFSGKVLRARDLEPNSPNVVLKEAEFDREDQTYSGTQVDAIAKVDPERGTVSADLRSTPYSIKSDLDSGGVSWGQETRFQYLKDEDGSIKYKNQVTGEEFHLSADGQSITVFDNLTHLRLGKAEIIDAELVKPGPEITFLGDVKTNRPSVNRRHSSDNGALEYSFDCDWREGSSELPDAVAVHDMEPNPLAGEPYQPAFVSKKITPNTETNPGYS